MKSLFLKMIIIFGFVVAASVLTLGFIIATLVEQELTHSTITLSLATVQARSKSFSEWIQARIGELEGLAALDDIAQQRAPNALTVLKAFRSTKENIYDLLFYGGLEGLAHTTKDSSPDISNRSYYIAMKNGANIAISEPIISRATGQPVFVIAKSIKEDNAFKGFVAGSIELKTLTATAESITLTEKGEQEFGFILTNEGVPLAFPDDNIRMNVSFTQEKPIEKEEIKQAFASWDGLKVAATEMVSGGTGWTRFTRNGTSFICLYAPIEHTPNWSLGVIVPAKTIFGTADRIKIINIIAVIVSTLIALAITSLVAKLISQPIVLTEQKLLELASGDANLTARLPVKSRDEVGKLANAFNTFLSKLELIIVNLKESIVENEEIGDSLAAGVEEISSTLNEVASNTESIRKNLTTVTKEMETIGSNASSTHQSAREIDELIEKLSATFANSSAAVEEMIASINAISHITEDKTKLVSQLMELGATGNTEIAATITLINELTNSINSIKDMVKIINSIAGQTNLLAMNAAIEAAHAGEAGAGFSVVATEIRNLAEDTNKRAKSISSSINDMINKISTASNRGNKTSTAFAEIQQGIEDVHRAFDETLAGIKELATGSNEIAQGLANVADLTHKIQEYSDIVHDKTKNVTVSLDNLNNVTNESQHAIDENAIGIREIANTMHELVTLGQRNKDNIHRVESMIGKFITSGDATKNTTNAPSQL